MASDVERLIRHWGDPSYPDYWDALGCQEECCHPTVFVVTAPDNGGPHDSMLVAGDPMNGDILEYLPPSDPRVIHGMT